MRGGRSGAVPASVMAPADTAPSFDSAVLAWHSAAYWQHGTVRPLAPFRSPRRPDALRQPGILHQPCTWRHDASAALIWCRQRAARLRGAGGLAARRNGAGGSVSSIGGTACRRRIRRRKNGARRSPGTASGGRRGGIPDGMPQGTPEGVLAYRLSVARRRRMGPAMASTVACCLSAARFKGGGVSARPLGLRKGRLGAPLFVPVIAGAVGTPADPPNV